MMNKVILIDFTSGDCKNSAHDECHGSWQGFGYEVICICGCHNRKGSASKS
jgi:hypothetical protein